uniref:Uncharacterized protein n=1 Tax=Dunaliella tertiolecta TaxID=3047 RepID=A0A7S3QYL8_DUNTE
MSNAANEELLVVFFFLCRASHAEMYTATLMLLHCLHLFYEHAFPVQRIFAPCPQVAHFQEMLHRNRANPSLASQIAQRLKDVQAELASEISEQARMSKSITGKDNQKKMMKF